MVCGPRARGMIGGVAQGPDRDDAAVAGHDDLTGRLLVAAPRLGDPNFERTVVLVLDHGGEGALGLVLNRPTALEVATLLEPWSEQARLVPPDVVFRGGPVSPDAVIGLARTEGAVPSRGRVPVLSGVDTVDLSLAPVDQPDTLRGARLYAGYAGWSADQLQGEVGEGAWFVVDGLDSDVFCAQPGSLWHDVLRRQGGALALLATYPAHPSVN